MVSLGVDDSQVELDVVTGEKSALDDVGTPELSSLVGIWLPKGGSLELSDVGVEDEVLSDPPDSMGFSKD